MRHAGGLSLKISGSMVGMKSDMAGAAAMMCAVRESLCQRLCLGTRLGVYVCRVTKMYAELLRKTCAMARTDVLGAAEGVRQSG